MDLREQLQTSIGDAYSLDRELGGGGMHAGSHIAAPPQLIPLRSDPRYAALLKRINLEPSW
jgi:hypothetical protein